MYFLSAEERKVLLRKLLPEARAAGVAEELRGWHWDKPPLAPIYEGRLSVSEVTSQLCQSGHDLYLRRVLRLRSKRSSGNGAYAQVLHAVARDVVVQAKRLVFEHGADCLVMLAELAEGSGSSRPIAKKISVGDGGVPMGISTRSPLSLNSSPAGLKGVVSLASDRVLKQITVDGESIVAITPSVSAQDDKGGEQADKVGRVVGPVGGCSAGALRDGFQDGRGAAQASALLKLEFGGAVSQASQALREHMAHRVASAVGEALSRYPKIGLDALVSAALPVVVEYQLDGSLLGLAKHLVTDILVLGEPIPVVVKFGPRREWHKLAATGYVLAMESLWECPVSVGCVAYVSSVRGRVVVERELFVIGDELRQQFIEARDERTRLIEEEIDPGLCSGCENGCRFNFEL